ncbi:MAG TPA: MMPL family transporter [Solirubrobacterales bacterium]|nr:MMPL family transporter [Solirubrobacterales bacterium]
MRRPWRTLAALAAPIAVLAVLGFGLDARLSPSSLTIPGTGAAEAQALLEEHFGPSAPFPILLRGPAPAIERQGPELVRALRRVPGVTTLSPWDRGAVGRLRPGPRRALIIADFHTTNDVAVKRSVPQLNAILARVVHPPLRATQTGYATISRAIQEESISSAERAELIALPILLVVLLLVFRSPVAAAIPLGIGGITVLSSRGLLWVLTHFFAVDALALTVCTMMGLALGVDYALLMVSRFREELGAGRSPAAAARATRATAGRTTAFAGSTLVISMAVAIFVVPGALLASLAATLILVVVLSVLVALLVVPPILVLLGPRVDRWRIGRAPREEDSLLLRFVTAALRRPAPVALAIGAMLLVLAGPALALRTGPLSPGQLPASDPVRQDYELVTRAAGHGFEAPFQVVVAADRGTMTEPGRLATLERWQHRIAAIPGVEAVVGPAQIRHATDPIHQVADTLLAPPTSSRSPLASLSRLGKGLGRASAGVTTLRAGLSEATYGAVALVEGGGRAATGAKLIARGLGRAEAGATKALASLEASAARAPKLVKAQYRAAFGAKQLHVGVVPLATALRRNAVPEGRRLQRSLNGSAHRTVPGLAAAAAGGEEHLAATLAHLEAMTVGKGDPEYAAALGEAREALAAMAAGGEEGGLHAALGALGETVLGNAREAQGVTYYLTSTVKGLELLERGSLKLREGLYRLARASKRIEQTLRAEVRRAQALRTGLPRLAHGATRLAAGTARLVGVLERLRDGLAAGYSRSAPLESGLGRAQVQVVSSEERLGRGRERLLRSSPHLFDSGYVVLSALDGAPAEARRQAGRVVDLEHGGQAATMLVFSRFDLNSAGSIALNRRLDRAAAAIGRDTDARAGVAGGPATLDTYSRVARDRIPLVVAAISLVTFLVLVLVLRALPLAALAVGLNLATVGVAFGVLTLLTYLPASVPLGGHSYIDAIGATLIFGVVFGLSIDYAVFLLVRMREHREEGASHEEAIAFGLDRTARVITGAAAIMMAVFIAFGGSSIATVSQLGIGLTIAVLLDATVVRIVLLPALMLIVGERVWWLPRPLARVLPRLKV